METKIDQAIELRRAGNFAASRELLTTLLDDARYASRAHLHIAWSYDQESNESAALPHYESALQGELGTDERFDALFGLASTLRSLGRYQDAVVYFELTIADYPDRIEVKPFYAMCLYNLGQYKAATELLLDLLVSTTDSAAIKRYQRAISLYAQDVDRTW